MAARCWDPAWPGQSFSAAFTATLCPQPCRPSVEGPGGQAAVSCLVLAELLAWALERPLPTRTSDSSPRTTEKAYLRSMAVSLCQHPQTLSPAAFLCAFSQTWVWGAHRVPGPGGRGAPYPGFRRDRKSTRLNSSH